MVGLNKTKQKEINSEKLFSIWNIISFAWFNKCFSRYLKHTCRRNASWAFKHLANTSTPAFCLFLSHFHTKPLVRFRVPSTLCCCHLLTPLSLSLIHSLPYLEKREISFHPASYNYLKRFHYSDRWTSNSFVPKSLSSSWSSKTGT